MPRRKAGDSKNVEVKKTGIKRPSRSKSPTSKSSTSHRQSPDFAIVGIGASAGGLEAFEFFFKNMPPDSGMAFVLVAHLDRTHVSLLPELLQKHTKMVVSQICDNTAVRPDSVYVIPPNKDLYIFNGILQLLDPGQPRGTSLPIDTFFRSLAQDQGARDRYHSVRNRKRRHVGG